MSAELTRDLAVGVALAATGVALAKGLGVSTGATALSLSIG
jgi:hypothetical protein